MSVLAFRSRAFLSSQQFSAEPLEEEQLSQPPPPPWFQRLLPLESFHSACLTLFASTLCSGLLLLPFTINLPGWRAGITTLFLSYAINLFTSWLLLKVAERSNRFTLDLIFTDVFCSQGKRWYHSVGLKVTELTVILSNFGSIVFHFMVVCCRQMVTTLDATVELQSEDTSNISYLYYGIGILWVVIIFPLSHFEMLTSLRFFSLFSFVCTLFVTILLASHNSKPHLLIFWSAERQTLSLLIALFTFTSQTNVCGIYRNMRLRQQRSFSFLLVTLTSVFVLAVILGVFGSWNSVSTGTNYPLTADFNQKNYNLAGSLSFAVALMLSTPLLVFPVVDLLFRMFWKENQLNVPKSRRALVVASILLSAALLAVPFSFFIEWCFMILSLISSLYICVILPCALYVKQTPWGEGTTLKVVCCCLILLTLPLYVLGPLYISFWVSDNESSEIIGSNC